MDAYALVLNAGSSSLKFCVYRQPDDGGWRLATRGQIAGFGSSPKLTAKDEAGVTLVDQELDADVRDGGMAAHVLAGWLREHFGGARVLGVGHRVVHGGTQFTKPCIVTPTVIEALRALVPLAPLHQPYNVGAIEAVAERLPDVPQVACFDTSFHRTQSAVAQLVPLPDQIRSSGVQRYGFHGLSYEYIASLLPRVAPGIAEGKIIVAHLGGGASLCALRGLESIENTFGFSTLDGLCMGTRPGALDPGITLHLIKTLGLSIEDVETMLYEQSGLLGISGISNDMRDLESSADPRARLAIDYFVYQASKHIGALAAVLGGLDALVFTAGIGERSATIRRSICEASAWLGVSIDVTANETHGPQISKANSRVAVWVIPTNEELMIARHMGALLR